MSDLNTQLRAYIEEIDPPFDPNTLMREANPATGPGKVTYRRLTPALVFVAAFILVLGAGAVLVLLRAPGSVEPAGPINEPTQTSTPTPATTPATTEGEQISAAGAEARVDEFHNAWNTGDSDAVRALLDPVVYSDNQRSIIDIAIGGFGMKLETDCDPATLALEVSCQVALSEDHFYTPADVTWTRHVVYQVGAEGILFDETPPFWAAGPSGEADLYLRTFDDWLYERTLGGEPAPNGWIWVDPENGLLPNALGDPCCPYSVTSTSAAPEIIGLVDEFLDEAIEYPLAVAEIVDLPGGTLFRKTYGDQTASAVFRGDELVFTLTHSCGECFGNGKELTREPNGVLSAEGWQGGVWSVNNNQQTEINRLWPPNIPFNMDVLWLTDYTGITADTLTGYTPEPGDTFTLYDELVLETRGTNKGLFALHADCRAEDDQIAAALFSFEGEDPAPLIGWIVDYTTMTFIEVGDPEALQIDGCLPLEPRPAN